MTMQVFDLSELGPSLNNIFTDAPNGRRVKTSAYRIWRDAAQWEIRRHRPFVFTGPVAVTLEMRRPNKRSDIDNRIKAHLDAVTGLVIADDKQVERVTACWSQTVDAVRITVEEIK